MRCSLDFFLNKLKSGDSFSVARFNDGEMGCIMEEKDVISRGDQKSSSYLRIKLVEALTYRDDEYYVGLPDDKFDKAKKVALDMLGGYENVTSSVIFHDKNWLKFLRNITDVVGGYDEIAWIGGDNHDTLSLPFHVDYNIMVNSQNGFDDYNKVKDVKFPRGTLVFLSCGPLGRVLAKELFVNNKDCTFLEIGSVFDPIVQNKWRRYQLKRKKEALKIFDEWRQNGRY